MRAFLGYTFRSREGLLSYLAYLGSALLGTFLLHMVILGVLIYDKYYDTLDLMLYENFIVPIAAVFFGMTLNRLMRTGVFGGTSRRSFILCAGAAAPVFAVITAAAVQLIYTVTALIYKAAGMSLRCLVTIDIWRYFQSPHELAFLPKTALLNIAVMFCMLMFAYALALLFVGIKNRLNASAAAVITGTGVFFLYFCHYNYEGLFGEMFSRLDETISYADHAIDPEFFGTLSIDQNPFTAGDFVITFIGAGLFMFIILYAVFALLTFRVPVRGKE